MEPHCRLAASTDLQIVDMVRPQSNFDFIDARFPDLVTMRRLLSLVRQHDGRTIVIERLEVSKDFAEEDEDVKKLCSDFSRSDGLRISFFSKSITKRDALKLLTDNDLIGYAVIKQDTYTSESKTRVFESIIRSPNRPNNFIKREPVWALCVDGKKFRVKGHLYAQQNGITNCCGHVAIRTAIASFAGKEFSYRRMNQILGISLKKRRPGDGIELAEMAKLLNAAGARCFEADYRATSTVPPPPFQKYVYGSVESGYPAIISFQTTSDVNSYHAIPTFGHTFNADTWVPTAERSYFQIGSGTRYIPSESWVSMYVGHDDNWGSHYCIPRHYFQTQHPTEPGMSQPGECVAHVISALPKKVRVSPIKAEAMAADFLFALRQQLPRRKAAWTKRLKEHIAEGLVVFRPVLVTTGEYAKHLGRVHDWEGKLVDPEMVSIFQDLDSKLMWMVEISVPELFSANLRKVGEVLIRAEKNPAPDRLNAFFVARLPGYFALLREVKRGKPHFIFIPSGTDGHVELFGYEENN